MTDKKLVALTKYWQKRLRLQDWEITTKFVKQDEIPGKAANNTYSISLKIATIKIPDPSEPTGEVEDVEESLVHELLHCFTAQFDNEYKRLSPLQTLGMEQMVDLVARALVSLKREGEIAGLRGQQVGLDKAKEMLNGLVEQ